MLRWLPYCILQAAELLVLAAVCYGVWEAYLG